MRLGELYMDIKSQLLEEDFFPLAQYIKDHNSCGVSSEEYAKNKEEVMKSVEYLELDIDKLYFTPKSNYHFYYIDGYVCFPVMLDHHTLLVDIDMNMKESYHYQIIRQHEMVKEKNFSELLSMLNEATVTLVLLRLIDIIPDDMIYEVLVNVYKNSDYGFDVSSKLILDNIQFAGEERNKRITGLTFDKDGYVEVYRGEEDKSTHYKESLSWTTDINTAIFFASRYTLEGKLYKGKVHKDNVIDYLKSESEVLSNKVESVKAINSASIKEMIDSFNNTDHIHYFQNYRNLLIQIQHDAMNFESEVHGVMHMIRVLHLSMTIAWKKRMFNKEDLKILAIASIFHDVGRENDYEDPKHGIRSWRIIKTKYPMLFDDVNSEEIIKFIIENHDVGDDVAKNNLQKYNMKNKKHAWKLYSIVCDADALDRVRINDIDLKYLRNSESYNLLVYAKLCLRYIQLPK